MSRAAKECEVYLTNGNRYKNRHPVPGNGHQCELLFSEKHGTMEEIHLFSVLRSRFFSVVN
ncbi:hypothetical protein RvY_08341 [Ramazzottius varieornatus]|uniref:Uncharacterized protein n=1 Tax=Ramazzottius varieornatus TaxID=947166 RepID=A0A1D1VEP7_RAMVA|nr:hypothetical protein RvY_08341 [Ramazzottius varieornatus]